MTWKLRRTMFAAPKIGNLNNKTGLEFVKSIMQLDENQVQFIVTIKNKVRQAQYEALKVVNVRLINLYWEIGQSIAEKQNENWGKAIVPKLSEELQAEFPGIGGFSTTNLWLMAQFYTEYHTDTNLQPLVGEISWSKHIVILNKCKQSEERQFYTMATKKFGWTKDVLTNQIENKTFSKYLINQTNFDQTIPDKNSTHSGRRFTCSINSIMCR